MKVLHISTYDRNGGASIAAFRLNEAMIKMGIDSKMLVLEKKSDATSVLSINEFKSKLFKYYIPFRIVLLSYIRKHLLSPSYTYSTGLVGISDIIKNPLINSVECIYVHWVQDGFLSIKDITKLIQMNKRIFFVLHDMWYITGGCNHSFDCLQWTRTCTKCQLIEKKRFKSLPKYIQNKKIQGWNLRKVTVIAPSKWLENCAQKSSIFNKSIIKCIPNTINTNTFSVIDRNICRNILGLPIDKKLILFGAVAGINNPYKGWNYANAVMKRLSKEAEIVVFGNAENTVKDFVIHSIGKITDETTLALVYNAVNVYISPTLAEAFGQTIVESISCGTKVVAFNVGGVSDIIDHKNVGYLSIPRDIDDFYNGIIWALNTPDGLTERNKLHKYIEERYSYQIISKKHYDMITNLKKE